MARSAASDPLEKFRFIIEWSTGTEKTALVRAGFHDVQMPKRTTTKGTYREGNDIDVPQLFPGLSSMEDVVMSRGLVPYSSTSNELYQWMSSVHNPSAGHATNDDVRDETSASNEFRKDVTIKMLTRDNKVARQWVLYNAFPVNFVAGSDLNAAEDGDKSLESLTLAYEDFKELETTETKPAGGTDDAPVSDSVTPT
jgi:phage tail-like protein